MPATDLRLDSELTAALQSLGRPLQDAARELITLELYRRGAISSGKAAQFLGMSRLEFVRHASRLGLSFFDMTEDEWRAERSRVAEL
jgi:predicted HTH domain antitoxin